MRRSFPKALLCVSVLFAALGANAAPPQNAKKTPTIRRVGVLGQGNNVEIEIVASQTVPPQTQVLSGPDRVVLDFPGAVPGADLHPMIVNRGDVKAVRVGLFKSNPPVTRVVLDLKAPQMFQLLPSRNTIIVKLGTPESGASSDTISARSGFMCPRGTSCPQISLSEPGRLLDEMPVRVSFQNGLLSVRAEKATLAQVLREVQRQTGTEIAIPADAENEPVVADFGPAPAKQVLAALLKGSHYDFILVGYDIGPSSLQRVILSPQSGAPAAETDDSAKRAQAAIVPTIEPQPNPAVATPLPNTPPDQNNLPPYRLQYSPRRPWTGQRPQMP